MTGRIRAAVFGGALLLLGGRNATAQTAGAPDTATRPGLARLGAVVQQRLQLTDDQTARLRETSRRYAEQRRGLLADERDARRTLREEVARGNAADQARTQGALDRLYQIQQRRSELAANEQRELATFLTPTQRAQYAGLQERAFRTAQALRQQRDAAALGAAPAPAQSAAERQAQNEARRQELKAERKAERRDARQAARALGGRRP